eukprot:g2343.t1
MDGFARFVALEEQLHQGPPTLQWWHDLRERYREARIKGEKAPFASLAAVEAADKVRFLDRFLQCVDSYRILRRQALDYLEELLCDDAWRGVLLSVRDDRLWIPVATSPNLRDPRCQKAAKSLLDLATKAATTSASCPSTSAPSSSSTSPADEEEGGLASDGETEEGTDSVFLSSHASSVGFLGRAKKKMPNLMPKSPRHAAMKSPRNLASKGNTLQIPGLRAGKQHLQVPGGGGTSVQNSPSARSEMMLSPVSCVSGHHDNDDELEIRSTISGVTHNYILGAGGGEGNGRGEHQQQQSLVHALRVYLGLARRPGVKNMDLSWSELEKEVREKCRLHFEGQPQLVDTWMRNWRIWLAENSKVADKSQDTVLQMMRSDEVLSGNVKFDPFVDDPLVKPTGIEGQLAGNCKECATQCYQEMTRNRVKIKGRGLYNHKPRYCVVCEAWFCGYCNMVGPGGKWVGCLTINFGCLVRNNLAVQTSRCFPTIRPSFTRPQVSSSSNLDKRKRLKTIASNDHATKFASYVCNSEQCLATFRKNKSKFVATPWDGGHGGILKDVALFTFLKRNVRG